MDIEKSNDGKTMTVRFVGEVDSMNAPAFEKTLLKEIEGVTDLTFDLEQLEYISSAGLRTLQKLQKLMKTQGNMVIINSSPDIMEIFKVTGFVRLLNII